MTGFSFLLTPLQDIFLSSVGLWSSSHNPHSTECWGKKKRVTSHMHILIDYFVCWLTRDWQMLKWKDLSYYFNFPKPLLRWFIFAAWYVTTSTTACVLLLLVMTKGDKCGKTLCGNFRNSFFHYTQWQKCICLIDYTACALEEDYVPCCTHAITEFLPYKLVWIPEQHTVLLVCY